MAKIAGQRRAMDLQELVNKTVELRFKNGHIVVGEVATVDVDEPAEIIYEVVRVVQVGPEKLNAVKTGIVALARVEHLAGLFDR